MKSGAILFLIALSLTGGFTWYREAEWLGRRDSSEALRLSGLVAAEEVTVSAEIDGRIRRMLVVEGDVVREGELLAILENDQTEARITYHKARTEQLAARLRQARELAELGEKTYQAGLLRAEAALQAARSAKDECEAKVRQLESEMERVNRLLADGIVARQQADRVRTRLAVEASRRETLEHRERAAESDRRLAEAEAGRLKVAALEVEQTRSQIQQERALLGELEILRLRASVRAPRAGVIGVRAALEGEVVKAGQQIVTIVDRAHLWVEVSVEESHIGRLQLGDVLPMELASGRLTNGKIFFISPEGGFATQRDADRVRRDIRTFAIRLRVAEEETRVHAGMTAYVTLPAADRGNDVRD